MFRGYADHMASAAFEEALARVLAGATREPTAVMCAESVWWRCHRRMLADAAVARGWRVVHLLDAGRFDEHRLHPNARLEGTRLVYDVAATPRLAPE